MTETTTIGKLLDTGMPSGASLFREDVVVQHTTDYVDVNHDIIGVEFKKSRNYGDVAIVEMLDNKAYMTTSATLKKQLAIIKEALDSGVKSVGVRLIRMKSNKTNNRYLLYVDPE